MRRNIALIIMVSLSLPIIAACGSTALPFAPVTILPEDCHVAAGEEMPLTLDGFFPPQAFVNWEVDKGRITFVMTGSDAVFIAPSTPAVVTISASITSAVPGMKTPLTRRCVVTAPKDLAQADGFEGFLGIWTGLSYDSPGLISH